MYMFRKCVVKTLDPRQKNIDGALNYVAECSHNPKVVLYQVAGNSLVNEEEEACIVKTAELL